MSLDKKTSDMAVVNMSEGIQKKLEFQTTSGLFNILCCQSLQTTFSAGELPEQLTTQMASCQTAANEFLRQFWLSLFPPQEFRSNASSRFAEQREAKTSKMIAFLQTTQEKVEALYPLARELNVDPFAVEMVRY